jgi:S-adenosylmethionine:tRNA ribosyltransferase-isomerase
VAFGAGEHVTRTEDRALPPHLKIDDKLLLGSLTATITAVLDHPRLVTVKLHGDAREIWRGIARDGRPIQYAHVPQRLELWDVWTAIAGAPAACESPSAGFALNWGMLLQLHAKGVIFATLTHAAGISSTGDTTLDAQLPFDEPYFIPASTAAAINQARGRARRVIAIGTTVVRALEHAGREGVIRAGAGLATQRIGATSQLRIADAILSGTHEPATSHYEMLRAFASDQVLQRADAALAEHGYLTHEFGDSVFLERNEFCDRSAGDQQPVEPVATVDTPSHCPLAIGPAATA